MWHGPVFICTLLFRRPPMMTGESPRYGSSEKGPSASHGSVIFCEVVLCSKLRYPNCEVAVSFYSRTTNGLITTCTLASVKYCTLYTTGTRSTLYLDTGISEAAGKVTVSLYTIQWRAKVWINEVHACGYREKHVYISPCVWW